MREWILAFSLGIFMGGMVPHLPPLHVCHGFLLPWLLSLRYRFLFLAGAFCLGIWWLLFQANLHKQDIIPHILEQQDLWAHGIVTGLPQRSTDATRFRLSVSGLCQESQLQHCDFSPIVVLLNDYTGLEFLPGQYWLLKVRLKRPHGFANPGSFDYEGWLFREGIAATGYIRESTDNRLLDKDVSRAPAHFFNRVRLDFQQRLNRQPLSAPGFLGALTIGDRFQITDTQWSMLSLTGTNHLMVISGLHISLVAWLVYKTSFSLLRLIPGLCLMVPASRLAGFIALLAAAIYSGLAGFSLPVQRALVMVCCLMSGVFLVRQTTPLNNLCLALLLVLLVDPLAPHSAGFWLSFLAVAALLLCLFREPLEQQVSFFYRTKTLIRTQLTLFLCLCPLMLLLFQQVTLLAPLVNLFAIPFVGMLVVPLCLAALVTGLFLPQHFDFMVTLPDFLLDEFTQVLGSVTRRMGFLLLEFPALPMELLFLLAAVFLLLCWHPGKHTAVVAMTASLMLFVWRPEKPGEGQFILEILDTGQGLSAVIQTREHLLIYDTGPAYSPRFNAGSGIIVPFLRKRNLGSPDRVLISHGDIDHAGGVTALHEQFPYADYLAGEQLPQAQIPVRQCSAGQKWQWDAVQFEILSPLTLEESGNNASCVLKVSTGRYSVLMPGDIELRAELALVRQYRDRLKADILIVPHHGSRTSSTPPFLRAVNPHFAVITAGYLNRFGHPHPLVQNRYQRFEATLLQTAATGSIRFRVSDTQGIMAPEFYRRTRPRFWAVK